MFPGPDSMGFVWVGVGLALMHLKQLLVVFATSPFLATTLTQRYPPHKGCEWGCCDGICLLEYERTFFCGL